MYFCDLYEVHRQTELHMQHNVGSLTTFTRQMCHPPDTKVPPLPFADVIGRLLGEHPLLEHVVECMDGAQLQSLLLMKHFSFAHNNTEEGTRQNIQNTRGNVTGGSISQGTAERAAVS